MTTESTPQETTVRVLTDTKARIAAAGKYGETIDDILRRILDVYEAHQVKTAR